MSNEDISLTTPESEDTGIVLETEEATPTQESTQGAPSDQASSQPEAPGTDTDWRVGLPDAWREELKDTQNIEDALAALKRGLGYTPPGGIDDVKLSLPDGVQVDDDVNKAFRELCVDKGITTEQAQALVDWQLAANKEILDSLIADGQKKLKESWGSRTTENTATAMNAVMTLDKKMGGKLSEALAVRGLHNDPAIVEAFYEVGTMISGDTLSGGHESAGPEKPEKPEDSYKGAFKE